MRKLEHEFKLAAMFQSSSPREVVLQGFFLLPFQFNFVTEVVKEIALSSTENDDADVFSEDNCLMQNVPTISCY